ncbi:hypothetical protein ACQKLP_15235 [Chitinophaga sp. NPDC101104]|uniref:hypothetical protein n=1 Tax=Chitinophaga sp. NPDC101104 TaxID=3390561 RepID=UPI003D0402C5
MKIGIMMAAMAASAIMACNSNNAQQETAATTGDSVQPATPAPAEAAAPAAVTGVVQEVMTGKDGYTAVIKSAQDSVYHVTISHANLKDHAQYRSARPGDTLTVSGDRWEMDGKAQITVRELK